MACLRAFFALFGLYSIISKTDGNGRIEEIQLDGDDFVSYKMGPTFIGKSNERHTLVLGFKTIHPNGMLLYIGNKYQLKDFVMLDLVQGKLRITINLGDHKPKLNGDLVVGSNLANNFWHVIKLALEGQQLNVTVRGKTTHAVLKSNYSRLDMDGYFYVGGLTKDVRDILQEYKPSGNFKGCLRDVYYHDLIVKILRVESDENIPMKMKRYREYGAPQFSCPHVWVRPVSFGHPQAFLLFYSKGSVYLNVKMHFRTYFPDGVLVFKGNMTLRSSPFVTVSLLGGEISLKIRVTNGGQLIELNSGKLLNDGDWHYLSVVVNETVVTLRLDQSPALTLFNPELKQAGKNYSKLWIGHSFLAPSFLGCIHTLFVDDQEINLFKSWGNRRGNLQNGCFLTSNCFPNHCLHRGKCNEVRSGGFSCDCDSTFYSGRLCEKPIYQKTCQEYKNLGLAEDATCEVDPDSEGPVEPFKVLCNASDKSHAVTVVRHDKAGPQRVSSGKIFRGIGYIHLLKYSVKVEQIRALIGRSESCRQFMKFKCFASKMHPAGHHPVRWKGLRQSLILHHWPGAPAGSNKCACGVNGTCANPRYNCNCDIGDSTWREDEGYVTDKYYLPVTSVMFPQSTAPQSSITVGPLECFGTLTGYSNTSDETLLFQQQAARFLYKLCDVLNPTTPQPRLDVGTPYERFPRITVSEKKTSSRPTTVQELLTTEQPTTELLTSSRSTERSPTGGIDPFDTELVRHVSGYTRTEDPTSSGTKVSRLTTEEFSSDLSMNKTHVVWNASPASVPKDDRLSWEILLTAVMLVIVSTVIVSVLGYFFVKQKRREACRSPLRPKKKLSLAEVYAGFPEVRLRPRSGELNLSDARWSIEAGSYNANTGQIFYGE